MSEGDERAEQVEVRALQKTVALDGGDLEGLDAGRGERGDGVGGRQPCSALAPALTERQAVPDVDGRDEPVGAVPGDQRRGEFRIAKQGGPDDGPGGAGAEGARDRLGGP